MVTSTQAADSRIASGELYQLDEAMRRLGWGIGALRAARRKGLVTRRLGKRTFVSGAELIAFVEKVGQVV